MPRFTRASLSLFAALVLGAAASAQDVSPASDAQPPLPATPTPQPKRDRAISDNLASSLAASMPKYNPPPKPRPEDEDVDLRDVDKPKNAIIRLPKYVVTEKKPAVFRERDLYSTQNRTGLAMQRYTGLNFGLFSDLNKPVALAMYQEQERLQNMADMKDTVRTVSVAEKADATYLKRLSDETYLRSGGDTQLDNLSDAWATIRSK